MIRLNIKDLEDKLSKGGLSIAEQRSLIEEIKRRPYSVTINHYKSLIDAPVIEGETTTIDIELDDHRRITGKIVDPVMTVADE